MRQAVADAELPKDKQPRTVSASFATHLMEQGHRTA